MATYDSSDPNFINAIINLLQHNQHVQDEVIKVLEKHADRVTAIVRERR